MAPLELVMGLPFLLFVAASAWSIGRAGLGKQFSAIQARHYAWQQRLAPERRSSRLSDQSFPNADFPMAISSTFRSDSGIFYGQTENRVRVSHWMGGTATPEGNTALVVHTWDHRQIDMSSTAPHFSLMWRMGQNPGGLSSALRDMLNIRSLLANLN